MMMMKDNGMEEWKKLGAITMGAAVMSPFSTAAVVNIHQRCVNFLGLGPLWVEGQRLNVFVRGI